MIKFSRAGWNNIIIFAVMGFILLINATHDNVFSKRESRSDEHTLFAEHDVILTLTINQQIKIERIGKTWRATPASLNQQSLFQMMRAWQQSMGEPIDEPVDIDHQLALVVSVELAGQATPVLFSLHVIDEQLLIYNHNTNRWLAFPMPIYNQLLPEQIFSS